ncbi:MAG: type II toxin-antitoxin system prevent-host-death family antitoxin [Kiritimatiellae bacterium]|nr:type II toxin-antitoxin system prevent-host-death family antitoxin [Kiritimatiellia bacterium]
MVGVINVFEAKNKLSGLLADVETNKKTYLICRNGKPVAKVVPHTSKDRLKGSADLQVEVKGDLYGDDMSGEFECLH